MKFDTPSPVLVAFHCGAVREKSRLSSAPLTAPSRPLWNGPEPGNSKHNRHSKCCLPKFPGSVFLPLPVKTYAGYFWRDSSVIYLILCEDQACFLQKNAFLQINTCEFRN